MIWGKLLEVFLCFSSISLNALSTSCCRGSSFSSSGTFHWACGLNISPLLPLWLLIFVLWACRGSHLIARSHIKAGSWYHFTLDRSWNGDGFLNAKQKIDIHCHIKIKHFFMAKTIMAKSKDKWQTREKHNHFMVEELISLICKELL